MFPVSWGGDVVGTWSPFPGVFGDVNWAVPRSLFVSSLTEGRVLAGIQIPFWLFPRWGSGFGINVTRHRYNHSLVVNVTKKRQFLEVNIHSLVARVGGQP